MTNTCCLQMWYWFQRSSSCECGCCNCGSEGSGGGGAGGSSCGGGAGGPSGGIGWCWYSMARSVLTHRGRAQRAACVRGLVRRATAQRAPARDRPPSHSPPPTTTTQHQRTAHHHRDHGDVARFLPHARHSFNCSDIIAMRDHSPRR